MHSSILLSLMAMASSTVAPDPNSALPDPKPPFEASSGKRLPAELKDSSFSVQEGLVQQPALWFGNKRVGVTETHGFQKGQDRTLSVYVDNREVLLLQFWGALKDLGYGYPFKSIDGQPSKLVCDEATKTISFSKPYALPDGGTAVFKWTLKALDNGKAELSWDCGLGDKKLKDVGVAPWLSFKGDCRAYEIAFDGESFDFPELSSIDPAFYKYKQIGRGEATRIASSPESPLKGVAVELPAKTGYGLMECMTGGGPETRCMLPGGVSGSLVLDFGISSSGEETAPPPVAGVDFWKRDAITVERLPIRNLLRNPGFEQGLRYWSWWFGGASYKPELPAPYTVVDGGLSGSKALSAKPYSGCMPMLSVPIAIENGKTYTVSYSVKAEKPGAAVAIGVLSAMRGSKLGWQEAGKHMQKADEAGKWERKSFSFVSDTRAVCIWVAAHANMLIDDLQLEEGDKASDFENIPVEGRFETAFKDNAIEFGKPYDAKFVLSGKPGSKGELSLSFRDFYRADVLKIKKSYSLDEKGSASFDLPLEDFLGKGLYIIRADFRPEGSSPYSDFYRLSILKSLENKHPTRTLFGNSFASRITKADELGEMYKRWGWGYNTAYGDRKADLEFLDKYRITHGPLLITYGFDGFGHITDRELIKKFKAAIWGSDVSPENLKFIEDTVYETVKENSYGKRWALSTESEGESSFIRKRDFDGYGKILEAFHRGVKHAVPDAEVYPDGGTSGWSDERGYAEIQGYLASTEGKVKWDAVAVHPYGDLDGVCGTKDLDAETAKLVELMKKHGYGPETPIDFDEYFNGTYVNIPEWGDDGSNDSYNCGLPSYDSGWKEFRNACWVARGYIISMKYWPQLRSGNIWSSKPFIDQELAPVSFAMVPNTLGNLFPNPKFLSDVRPAAGVRGYAFESGDDVYLAIWCVSDKVDEGFEHGPELAVDLRGLSPEVLDLMGNKREFSGSGSKAAAVRLTPAPLFFKVPKKDGEKLVAAFSKAEAVGVGSSLRVSFLPTVDGGVEAKLVNQTGFVQKGKLVAKDGETAFEVPPAKTAFKALPFKLDVKPGEIQRWKRSIGVEFANGKRDDIKWDMSCFYVPRAAKPLPLDPDAKEWSAIPALPLNNWFVRDAIKTPRFGQPGDLEAKFQLAWDKDNLYVRVEGSDDKPLVSDPEKWNVKNMWLIDRGVELYLDTTGNARGNSTRGYDQYDYRYNFGPGSAAFQNGPGSVWRETEVFCQLAGGMSMPTKEDAAKGVKCEFRSDGKKFSYVMILPQLYLEPLRLEKGWRAGFGLCVNDKDEAANDSPEKGVCNSTKKGEQCFARPDLWPIMVLGD